MKKDRIQSRMKNFKVIPWENESRLPRDGRITEWRSRERVKEASFRETYETINTVEYRAQGLLRGISNIMPKQNLRRSLLYLHLSHIYFEDCHNVTVRLDTLRFLHPLCPSQTVHKRLFGSFFACCFLSHNWNVNSLWLSCHRNLWG